MWKGDSHKEALPMIPRVLNIAKKEFLSIFRDKLSMLILIVLPVVIVGILGNALRFDLKELRFGVLNKSGSPVVRRVVSELDQSSQFRYVSDITSDRDAERLFIEDDIKFLLFFPSDFSRGGVLQVFVDGSDLVLSEAVTQSLSVMLKGGYPFEVSFKYNPGLRSDRVPLPGLVMIALIIVSSVMLGMSVNREREEGTGRLLMLSPSSPLEIVAGKAVPYLLISLMHGFSVFFLSRYMFGIEMNNGIWLFLMLTFVFSFNSMITGLFIASLVKNQLELLIGCWLFVFIPNVFFSGFVYPLQSVHTILLPVARYIPGALFIEAYKGMVFRATSLSVNAEYFAMLIVQAFVLFVVTVYLFKRNFFRK